MPLELQAWEAEGEENPGGSRLSCCWDKSRMLQPAWAKKGREQTQESSQSGTAHFVLSDQEGTVGSSAPAPCAVHCGCDVTYLEWPHTQVGIHDHLDPSGHLMVVEFVTLDWKARKPSFMSSGDILLTNG